MRTGIGFFLGCIASASILAACASEPPLQTSAPPSSAARPAQRARIVFGQQVTLSGTLVWHDVGVLVNGGVNGAERTGRVPFLVLDTPVDVGSGKDGINVSEPQNLQREMQVGFNDLEKARPFFARHVTVQGELTPQMTAHHYSSVVIVLADLIP